jgi:hypothetical protein
MDDSQRMGWAREGEGGRVRVGGGGTHREFVESWLESRVGTAARPAFLLLVLWVAHRHDTTRHGHPAQAASVAVHQHGGGGSEAVVVVCSRWVYGGHDHHHRIS